MWVSKRRLAALIDAGVEGALVADREAHGPLRRLFLARADQLDTKVRVLREHVAFHADEHSMEILRGNYRTMRQVGVPAEMARVWCVANVAVGLASAGVEWNVNLKLAVH